MKTVISASIFSLLCACSSAPTSQLQAVETACASATAAINTATVLKNARQLTPAELDKVDLAIATINPVCSSPTPPNASTYTLAAVNSALTILVGVNKSHER